ncbi:MAG: ATP-grasp domain-containing protein [Pseudomonadales bacterium]
MGSILFLLADEASAHNDNHRRLPEGFRAAGWRVACAPHGSLALANGVLLCAAGRVDEFERIWCLGFGEQASFFDRMQLLSSLPQDRFVTTVEALLLLHGKFRWQQFMPESYVSNDAGYLLAQTGRGDEWVVKPTAGSYGRDVYRLGPEHSEAQQQHLLRTMTADGRYALLQRYLPQIEQGEKRVLFAGGELLGTYLRRPAAVPRQPPPHSDFSLANIAAGGTVANAHLAKDEMRLAQRIGNELLAQGVGFAAIDLVYPYLMEVNIANPGGLGTLLELTGEDHTAQVVAALVELWV